MPATAGDKDHARHEADNSEQGRDLSEDGEGEPEGEQDQDRHKDQQPHAKTSPMRNRDHTGMEAHQAPDTCRDRAAVARR